MKKVVGVALLLVVAVFLLPFLIHRGMEQEQAADPAAQGPGTRRPRRPSRPSSPSPLPRTPGGRSPSPRATPAGPTRTGSPRSPSAPQGRTR